MPLSDFVNFHRNVSFLLNFQSRFKNCEKALFEQGYSTVNYASFFRAKDSGVNKIMVTGTSIQSSKDALRLSRLYPGALYATAGVHPHDAKSWDEDGEDTLEVVKDLIKNPEVVAIGECGLDFNRNFSPPNVQLDVFEKQVCFLSWIPECKGELF